MTNKRIVRQFGVGLVVYLLAGVWALPGWAQTAAVKKMPAKTETLELKAEKNLATAKENSLQLRHFLLGIPKGADLHYHLTGGVYAETFIREGAEDGLCVDVKTAGFTKCPADVVQGPDCADQWKTDAIVPAKAAYCEQGLYDALVDSFSMRGFVPYAGKTAHDHFFDAFAKFSPLKQSHLAEWVDEVAVRAAGQNEQYLELMHTPDFSKATEIAKEVSWTDDFAKLREDLLAHGLGENVKSNVEAFQGGEKKRREMEHCGEADAAPACKVDVRFLWQILRRMAPEVVFAQAVVAFESAQADPERIVGISLVSPEDGYVARRDYALHMRMIQYLHQVYPKVHIELHAGEITYGVVPLEDLCCHIRMAVEAGAERIGHGLDEMYETRPHELMREMAAKHVMVEINLSSNDLILGVSGKNHPLPLYRQFGVPVALSSDDEGVSRIDLTNEYARAVTTYELHYADLKKMSRTGLEHAFLPGASLWESLDDFSKRVNACANDVLGAEMPSKGCAEFLQSSEKATQQWELERRFRQFEANL